MLHKGDAKLPKQGDFIWVRVPNTKYWNTVHGVVNQSPWIQVKVLQVTSFDFIFEAVFAKGTQHRFDAATMDWDFSDSELLNALELARKK